MSRALVVLALLAGVALAAAPAAAATANLLLNPGFEEDLQGHFWMPAAWDTSRSGLPYVFFGRDTLVPHSGQYSVSVASPTAEIPMAHNWSQAVTITPDMWGKDLVFSVWTKSLGIEGRAYVLLQCYRDSVTKMSRTWGISRDDALKRLSMNPLSDPLLELGWKREFLLEPRTEWVRREVRLYVAPSTNMAYIRCGLLGSGQLSLDDASLTVEPAVPSPEIAAGTNLIQDPGFEGDGTAWEQSLPPYPGLKAVRETKIVHSGKASGHIVSNVPAMIEGKTGFCQVLSNRNLSGKRVRFTGWARLDSLGNNVFLSLYTHSLKGMHQEVSPGALSGTTDWSKLQIETDIPPDTYSVWAWFSYSSPTQGRVYFDDANLQVLGPAGSSSSAAPTGKSK